MDLFPAMDEVEIHHPDHVKPIRHTDRIGKYWRAIARNVGHKSREDDSPTSLVLTALISAPQRLGGEPKPPTTAGSPPRPTPTPVPAPDTCARSSATPTPFPGAANRRTPTAPWPSPRS